jgi:hypothetical protein
MSYPECNDFQVEVTEESESLVQFLVRLCAIIGGVYATVGMLYNHLSFLGCKVKSFRSKTEPSAGNHSQAPMLGVVDGESIKTNLPQNPILQTGSLNMGFQSPLVNLVPSSCDTTNNYPPVENQEHQQQSEANILPDLISHTKP